MICSLPSPTVWLATQNHSTLVTERSAVPFLPVNPEYSATRNQVRSLGRELRRSLPFLGVLSSQPAVRGGLTQGLLTLGSQSRKKALLFSTWGSSLFPRAPLGT